MYLRIKPDGIHISCHFLVTKGMILSFIVANKDSILKSSEIIEKKEQKKEEFYYIEKKYNVILLNTISKIEFVDDNVYVKNKTFFRLYKNYHFLFLKLNLLNNIFYQKVI